MSDQFPKNVTVHISPSSVLKAVLVLLFVAVAFVLRDLLLVVLAAVVIASAIEPIIKWFIRRRIPRLPAVLLIFVSLAGFLVSLFFFLVLPLLNETSQFLSSLPNYVKSVDLWSPFNESSVIGSQPVVQDIQQSIPVKEIVGQINSFASNISGGFINAISAVFGGILSFVLIIVLSFYLSVQEQGIAKFLKMVTPNKHRPYVLDLWKRAETKIGLWLQGQLMLVIIIGVLTYLGLLLLGVKHALLLATLAGIFELIPVFGLILSVVPALAVAAIDGGATLALLVLGLYLIIQQFENQLIYPVVVRKVVGVPAIVVILALIAGAQLAGFLGILLSVPVAAILLEFLNDFQKEKLFAEPKDTDQKTEL